MTEDFYRRKDSDGQDEQDNVRDLEEFLRNQLEQADFSREIADPPELPAGIPLATHIGALSVPYPRTGEK